MIGYVVKYFPLLILYFIPFLFQCGNSPVASVETTNGTGTIRTYALHITGTVPVYSRVYISESEYIPNVDKGNSFVIVADKDGQFECIAPKTGSYTIHINDSYKDEAAIISNVIIDTGNVTNELKVTLKKTGTINGTVRSLQNTDSQIMVFLKGTAFFTVLDSSGPYVLNGIPEGSYIVQAVILKQSSQVFTPQIVTESNSKTVTVNEGKSSEADSLIIE